MKFLATILSVLVIFLSTTANVDDSCLFHNECRTEQHATENHPYNCSDCCSPFCLCQTCVGFTIHSGKHYQIKQPELNTKEINLYILPIYSSPVITGIWQPPKFV
jgi:hypothetical protein